MVKKNARFFAALLAFLLLAFPCCALAGVTVVDDADLFTNAEIRNLESMIENIRETYRVDAVILTSRSVGRNHSYEKIERTVAFADDYYDSHGCGLGDDRSGVLYLIDMNNRVSYLSTGGVMIDYMTDNRVEKLLSAADPYLASGAYGKAAESVLISTQKYLKQGRQEGSFRYDEVTGERLTGVYKALTRTELIVAVAVGLGVTLIFGGSVVGTYRLRGKTYKYDWREQSYVTFDRRDEHFIRQRISRIRHSDGPRGGGFSGGGSFHGGGGGSHVHISSGGSSHGGGGHHF